MRNENDTDVEDTDEQQSAGDDQHTEYGGDDGHIYVDRDKIDFDPEDGLLAGTAVDGTSDIPGSPSNDDDEDTNDNADDGEEDSG
jgi:hypothetical protein